VILTEQAHKARAGSAVDTSIALDDAGSLATVAVRGDVDLATTPDLDAAIDTALAMPDTAGVVVDLSDVGFLDSSGISSLLKGRRHADRRGATYRIAGATGIALRVLEMSGVWEHLTGDAPPNIDES
jgi:anti-sigma B factor antagonist